MSAEQDHTYKFGVSMSCGGCSGAINRVLGKLDGMFISGSILLLRVFEEWRVESGGWDVAELDSCGWLYG